MFTDGDFGSSPVIGLADGVLTGRRLHREECPAGEQWLLEDL
jgi:hypothetical protein